MKKQNMFAAILRHATREIALRIQCAIRGTSVEAVKAYHRARIQRQLDHRRSEFRFFKSCYPERWIEGLQDFSKPIYHYGE